MKHVAAAVVSLLLAASLALTPAASSQSVSGKDVLAPTAYVSFDPVARGMAFQVAVVLKIRPGFHVNAREVTFDYLIPTDLKAEVPTGFKMANVIYPKGTLQTFTFAKDKPLNVYSDSVTVRLPLTCLARRSSRRATSGHEASLSGLQLGNLSSAGDQGCRGHHQCRRRPVRRKTR